MFEVAAPGLYGEQATRDWRSGYAWWRGECRQYLAAYARDYGLWIALATQAGHTVNEDFPGGYLFRPDGGCAYETADWSEGLAFVTAALSTNPDNAPPESRREGRAQGAHYWKTTLPDHLAVFVPGSWRLTLRSPRYKIAVKRSASHAHAMLLSSMTFPFVRECARCFERSVRLRLEGAS